METATYIRIPYVARLLDRVTTPADSEETIRIKATIIGNTVFVQLSGIVITAILLIFGEPMAAGVVVAGNLLYLPAFTRFLSTKEVSIAVTMALTSFLLSPFVLTLVLGGFINSGVVIIFSAIYNPASAVLLGREHQARRWYFAGLLLLILVGILQTYARESNNLPPKLVDPILFVVNIGLLSGLLYGALGFLGRDRDRVHRLLKEEQEQSERLLLNVLPEEIAPVLKAQSGTIAEHFESASVLFADIPGSMQLFTDANPEHIVDWLNEIFSSFDRGYSPANTATSFSNACSQPMAA